MPFNSIEFVVFTVIIFIGYPCIAKYKNLRSAYIVIASFFFYAEWNCLFLIPLIANGILGYCAALAMARFHQQKKKILIISIVIFVATLATSKYLNFVIANMAFASRCLGINISSEPIDILAPVGISFYTFQLISYLVGVYNGCSAPTNNILHFFAYLSMFPHILAGPIVRASDLLPQLETDRITSEEKRWEGTRLIAYGYFKKTVVADNLATAVNSAFSLATPLNSCSYWWVIMVMFSFQIYCDFSGYSDIARGLAKWMGFDFPVNFDHPYTSASMREFWRRWHISLSTWFRDYLYVPLGGSQHGAIKEHRNLWITMIVSGLWHGAAWTFVFWGMLHALYVSFERLTGWPEKLKSLPFGRYLSTMSVFILTLVAWVFFRSQSFSQAFTVIPIMFDFKHIEHGMLNIIDTMPWYALVIIISIELYNLMKYDFTKWLAPKWKILVEPIALSLLLVSSVLFRGPSASFIYFQF